MQPFCMFLLTGIPSLKIMQHLAAWVGLCVPARPSNGALIHVSSINTAASLQALCIEKAGKVEFGGSHLLPCHLEPC